MKRSILIALLIFAFLFLIISCAGMRKYPEKEEVPSPAAVETTLIPSPESPLISFRIAFHVGSIHDAPGKEGIAALTAYTIGYGGTQQLTYEEVIKKLYPMAASIGVQVDKEETVFTGNVHVDYLEDYYQIFSELLLNPRFDPSDFKRNKDILLNYIKSTLRGTDDENLGKEALNVFMYSEHPYGRTNAGTVKGLESITLEDVKDFYRTHYTRRTLEIGLAGGYSEEFLKLITSDFSALPDLKVKPVELPDPEPIEGIEVMIVKKEAIATAISFGFPIDVTRSDKDFYALLVANSYLGEHRTFNGILMQRMRGARGLNYGDYSYIENFIQDGGSTFPVPNIPRRQQFFSVWIRPVAHANAHFALRQAIREIQLMVDNGISQEDFEETRDFLINYSKLWVQTPGRRLGYLMDSKFYGIENYIDRIEKELSQLTVEQVNEAIRKYLQYDNIKVAIVTRDAETLKENLIADKISPIVYQTPGTPQHILEEDKEIKVYPLNINAEKSFVVSSQELFEE